jgi:hypothetical protein
MIENGMLVLNTAQFVWLTVVFVLIVVLNLVTVIFQEQTIRKAKQYSLADQGKILDLKTKLNLAEALAGIMNERVGEVEQFLDLLKLHSEIMKHKPCCCFELSYTRQTQWVAYISNGNEADSNKEVLTTGQGNTVEDACRWALVLHRDKEEIHKKNYPQIRDNMNLRIRELWVSQSHMTYHMHAHMLDSIPLHWGDTWRKLWDVDFGKYERPLILAGLPIELDQDGKIMDIHIPEYDGPGEEDGPWAEGWPERSISYEKLRGLVDSEVKKGETHHVGVVKKIEYFGEDGLVKGVEYHITSGSVIKHGDVPAEEKV